MYRTAYNVLMSERLYKILGASPSCSDEELRSVYRKLVRTAHPDVCGSTPDNVRRFLEIQEAYNQIVELRRGKPAKRPTGQRNTRPSPAYAKPSARASTPNSEPDDFIEEMFDTLCKDLNSLASGFKSIFKRR